VKRHALAKRPTWFTRIARPLKQTGSDRAVAEGNRFQRKIPISNAQRKYRHSNSPLAQTA
jgi:hypothetical protein